LAAGLERKPVGGGSDFLHQFQRACVPEQQLIHAAGRQPFAVGAVGGPSRLVRMASERHRWVISLNVPHLDRLGRVMTHHPLAVQTESRVSKSRSDARGLERADQLASHVPHLYATARTPDRAEQSFPVRAEVDPPDAPPLPLSRVAITAPVLRSQ